MTLVTETDRIDQDEIDRIEEELDRLEDELPPVRDAMRAGRISLDEALRQVRAINRRHRQVASDLATLEARCCC